MKLKRQKQESNETAPIFEIPIVPQEGESTRDRGQGRQPYTICEY